MTFVTAKDPTKRAAKHPTKRVVTSNYNNSKNNHLTPITTTTTNNTTAKTPNDTELDHKPEDYKINHNNQCPEQQKVWSDCFITHDCSLGFSIYRHLFIRAMMAHEEEHNCLHHESNFRFFSLWAWILLYSLGIMVFCGRLHLSHSCGHTS